jgi:serine/threonine protein kinase
MAAQNENPVAANVSSVIKIPGYKIKGILGRGGMAVVYLAEQESIGREVALKVLAPDHTDDTFSQRFLAEARIISQLSHPNIVTVFDAGVHQGNHYMAMEYIKGKTLTDARDDMNLKARIEVIKQIADALDYAGGKGYVHRDIKPENIMCHEDGRAILMDFGIARSLDTTKGLTVTGKAIGTPYYMSPEQTKGLKVDPRADIYSLGVVLFQVLAGRVPYDGPSFVAVGIKHISEPIPLLPPGFEAFQEIINNSMSKEPAHRYQAAGELKQALEALPESVFQRSTPSSKMARASTQVHQASTVMDDAAMSQYSFVTPDRTSAPQAAAVSSSRQQVPSFRPQRKQETLPPIDITASDDFKRLRRRRWLLYSLFIATLALGGYYRQDIWLPTWQYDVAPWLAANVPNSQVVLKYLPPPKEKARPPVAERQAAMAADAKPPTSVAVVERATPILPPQKVVTNEASEQASVPPESAPTEPTQLTPEEERNLKIEKLIAGLDKHNENALKLAILYESILVHERDNQMAKQGLEDLQGWFARTIREAIDGQQWEQSRLLLNMLKESFPQAPQLPHFKFMEEQTRSAEKLQAYLQKAAHFMEKKQYLKPVGANALEEFNKALLIAPKSAEAIKGVQEIAEHFYQHARQEQKAQDIQAAINSTRAGLTAVKDHRKLLALQDELQYSLKQQEHVRNLLGSARAQMVNGNLITPRGKSAYDLYQVVLSESPNNPAAIKGLEMIERKLVQHIRSLMQQGQYRQADQNLQIAQQYFRDSRALNFLQGRLTRETYRPQ